MSFLFHKRTKRFIQFVWGFLAIIIIVSMVFLFAPGLVDLILSF